jgi:large subunit ribosomal protein L16
MLAFKKVHNKLKKGFFSNHNKVTGGLFYLKALESGNLNLKHLEILRRSITKKLGNSNQLKFRVKPNQPITKKGEGARMGSGVGRFDKNIFKIRKGHIILELSDVPKTSRPSILRVTLSKLPFKVS